MTVAVVTAFSAGYDVLEPPDPAASVGADFFAFVESPLVSKVPAPWRPCRLPEISRVAKRRCLYVKTHLLQYFARYDAVIWMDARLRLREDPGMLVERELAEADLASFRHPRNATLADEIAEIRESRLVGHSDLDAFEAALGPGDTDTGPISETNLLVARPTEANKAMFANWWARIEGAPARDQLTFDRARIDADASFVHLGGGRVCAATSAFVAKGRHSRQRPRRAVDERHQLPRALVWPREVERAEQPVDRLGYGAVTVVVPVHNGLEALSQCVTSILEADEHKIPVVLVDNGSAPETSRYCAQLADRYPQVRHDQHDEPLGFGAAANRGVSICATPYVFLANSDLVLPTGWVDRLATTPVADDILAVGFVSNQGGDHSVARGLDQWRQPDLTARRTFIDLAAEFCREWHGDGVFEPTRSVHGAAMLLRRDRFAELGGFDSEAFPVGYGEEVDLCLRAAAAGMRCGVDPSQFFFHYAGASFGSRRHELNEAGKRVLRQRYPARLLQAISDDLRTASSIAALSADLEAFLPGSAR